MTSDERPESTGSKIMFSLSSVAFFLCARSGFLRFFNLYDKSRPENQTKRDEIDLFRTISEVLVYVLESFSLRFCSKRIDFRAILRNTMGTPVDWGLSFHTEKCKRAFLKESSSNPRRMLAGFFLKKVVFSFSESGLFFSFSLFLC